jgi:hypothetical protein
MILTAIFSTSPFFEDHINSLCRYQEKLFCFFLERGYYSKGRGEGVYALGNHPHFRDVLCNSFPGKVTAGAWLCPCPTFPINKLTNGDHSHKFKTEIESKSSGEGTFPKYARQEKLYGD